jgi:hypothetical protein
MKTLLACWLVIASSVVLPSARAADKPVVVFDRAHGHPAVFDRIKVALERFATFTESTQPLTTDALGDARLLYLRTPTTAFTADEKKAVVKFLRRGGSLLLIVDEQSRTDIASTGVNDLIAPFGLTITADTEYLHNCGGIARAGEIHAAERQIPYSGGRAVQGGTPFAYRLDAAGNPAEPFAAYQKLPRGGRIVVMGEAMASILLGPLAGERLSGVPRDARNTTYWGKDSDIFMDEVTAWLLAR